MALKLEYKSYTLDFKFDAGTSRGILKQKTVWYLKVYQPDRTFEYGIGEVATLEGLSVDYKADMEFELALLTDKIIKSKMPTSVEGVYSLVKQLVSEKLPSIKFGLETALLDLINGGKKEIFANGFYQSEKNIPINGLVWMGDKAFMKKQIDEKIKAGFKCIKIKIGAIDFEEEIKLLRYIKSTYSDELTLRVDANGAFTTQKAILKLKALQEFDLHSIEQPIMPNQIMSMKLLCAKSIVPIALDEELVGVNGKVNKAELLNEIKPQYIILKPSLLGGFHETSEWIKLAKERNIGWWITSALESNIGLNAICQFTSEYKVNMHQGLGTGMLYKNNFDSPLTIKGESIYYNQKENWGAVF